MGAANLGSGRERMFIRWTMFIAIGLLLLVGAPTRSLAVAISTYCVFDDLVTPGAVESTLPKSMTVPRASSVGIVCPFGRRAISSGRQQLGNPTLLYHLLATAIFFIAAYFLGRGVRSRGWNANETRKALGAIMLASPWLLGFGRPPGVNETWVVLGYLVMLMSLLLFWAPVRRRSQLLQTAFAAIDRPEDRPHTLTWLATSFFASAVATLLMAWWVLGQHRALAFTVMFSVIIGDLLAGAVGYRFGKHRFATTALFTNKRYTRSLEGSACVVLTTLIILASVSSMLPWSQFVAAAFLLPLALTLAEAKSPHTWDEPIMTVVGTVVCLAIVTLLPA